MTFPFRNGRERDRLLSMQPRAKPAILQRLKRNVIRD